MFRKCGQHISLSGIPLNHWSRSKCFCMLPLVLLSSYHWTCPPEKFHGTFSLFLISPCVSLRGTKGACPSACLSTATCCVSSTVTWPLTCDTPKREWMSLSTSWTCRNLTLKVLQELLTTGETWRRSQSCSPCFCIFKKMCTSTFLNSSVFSSLYSWTAFCCCPPLRHIQGGVLVWRP